ncbi:hypothetical protein N865_00670 [Intrasporangium oryzae NRRL B-24470]|uniref:Polysaccharide biosynthesis protein n=1 Tax=Intrasporangium oryzae NRRL B-24470 TaxID=1386089 RepID=W9GCN5_9MICO|nr:lipopolysaccharide biosynthesis protein [Intrasporangium oryzae]EWT02982.1 hypothetical protein N865_00670 [Intrasporangium oryzae NRRL B-24470]
MTHPVRRSRALRGGIVIALATGVMNLATYAFTLISARRLGPADYGAFAAMLGLVIVVNVVSLGLQATGARRVAEEPGDRQVIEERVMTASRQVGAVLTIACLAATPVVASVLGLDSLLTAGLLAVPAWCFAVMGGQAGILQGEGRWVPLALVFASLGLARVVLGTVAIAASPTSLAAMAGGVAAAAVVPVVVGAVALRHTRRRPSPGATRVASGRTHDGVLREALASSHALLAFFVLATVDIVVARIVLDEHDAGLYAAGLIVVKAVQFLPQFVVVVAFPAMARRRGDRRLHLWGLAIILALGSVVTLATAAVSDRVLALVGGPQYADVQALLWVFAVVGTLLAAVQLLVYSALAQRQRGAVTAVWAAVGVVVLGSRAVGTGAQLLELVVAADALLLCALLILTRREVVADGAGGPDQPAVPGSTSPATAPA